jgi:hypothetical protein
MSLYRSVLDQILYFTVSNFILILSDTHCKLEWELLAKYKQENISNDNILHPMSPNYMGWWVCCSLYNGTGLRWNPKPITVVQQ